MAKPEVDPFDELRKKLEKPVKLSETEKKKIEEIFTELDKLLEETRKEVLNMDQPAAYRYMGILLRKFGETRSEFDGKVNLVVEKRVAKEEPARPAVQVNRKPGDFREYFNQLSPELQEKGQRLLGCIKSALQLEADGGDPSELLCAECSAEAMEKCIQGEDPNIKDKMDENLEFHVAEDSRRGGARR